MVKASYLTYRVAVSALWDVTQLKVSWPCFCFAKSRLHLNYPVIDDPSTRRTQLCVTCLRTGAMQGQCSAPETVESVAISVLQISNIFQSCLCPMLWADSVHAVSGPALYHTNHKALGWEERHLTPAWDHSERREVTKEMPNIELPPSQYKHHIVNTNEFKGCCTSAPFL